MDENKKDEKNDAKNGRLERINEEMKGVLRNNGEWLSSFYEKSNTFDVYKNFARLAVKSTQYIGTPFVPEKDSAVLESADDFSVSFKNGKLSNFEMQFEVSADAVYKVMINDFQIKVEKSGAYDRRPEKTVEIPIELVRWCAATSAFFNN